MGAEKGGDESIGVMCSRQSNLEKDWRDNGRKTRSVQVVG